MRKLVPVFVSCRYRPHMGNTLIIPAADLFFKSNSLWDINYRNMFLKLIYSKKIKSNSRFKYPKSFMLRILLQILDK